MRTMTLTLDLENGATITKTTIIISARELDGLVASRMLLTDGDTADAIAILVAEDPDEAMDMVTVAAKVAYDLADEDIWHLDYRPLKEGSGGS